MVGWVAHSPDVFSQLLRGFGQWYEGSLMDWQIGDLYDMANGCTAGDIRVNYKIADPESLSVIGQMSADGAERVIVPFRASNGFQVRIAHAGLHEVDDMFENETAEAHYLCYWARLGALVAGGLATFLLTRVELGQPIVKRRGLQLPLTVSAGLGLLLVGAVWAAVYGAGMETGGALAAGAGLLVHANASLQQQTPAWKK